jgi:hypothetical protein
MEEAMRTINRWTVPGLILASLLLSACTQAAASSAKVEPAKAEEIEGSELKRVTLTEKAAERIDLQTVAVREEQTVLNQTLLGEVVDKKGDAAANSDQLWVRAPFNETDFNMVALDQPARVLLLTDDDEEDDSEDTGWTA